MDIKRIPDIPISDGDSFSIREEVIIRNIGVKDRKGMVRDNGDSFSPFIYRIKAVSSRGIRRMRFSQNSGAIGVDPRKKSERRIRNGVAKNSLPHPTRMKSISFKTYFDNTSTREIVMALKSPSSIQDIIYF